MVRTNAGPAAILSATPRRGSMQLKVLTAKRNRHTLETMADYSFEQGLTRRKMPLDELFVSVFQGRKRGDKFGV